MAAAASLQTINEEVKQENEMGMDIKMENEGLQMEDINQSQPIKVSLSNLLRNDSVMNNDNNNLSNVFIDDGEGFFGADQNDVLNVGVVDDNDFGMENNIFQSQNPLEPELEMDKLPDEQNQDLPLLD